MDTVSVYVEGHLTQVHQTPLRYAHQNNHHPPRQPLPPASGGGVVTRSMPHTASSTAGTTSTSPTLSPLHRSPPAPSQQPQALAAVLVPPVPESALVTQTETLTPQNIATLGHDRPRARNEYVDSPTLLAVRQNIENNNKVARSTSQFGNTVSSVSSAHALRGDDAIVVQPQNSLTSPRTSVSSHLKKNASVVTSAGVAEEPCQDSIICPQCGKCRCHACSQTRELPRKWLCQHSCELSFQKAVDVCSCLCCVKAFFYHGCRELETEDFVSDEPCACCQRPHCFKRWACMGLVSVCLPCLCFYWPLRCALAVCTSCYNGCSQPGCHCRRADKLPASKRLLIDSESSST